MSVFFNYRNLVYGFLAAALLAPVYADDHKNIHFHGFASQSFLYTNKNRFFGNSDDGSFKYYELGGNVTWEVNPKLRFSAQVLIRDAGTSDNSKDRIDYAFGEYTLVDSVAETAGIRVGRVINPFGFYNATRDVAGTRPSILLPQSVYVDSNRNFSISADGVQLYYRKHMSNGELMFDIGKSKPRTRDPDLEVNVLGQVMPGSLEGNDASWLAKLAYEYDFGRWRFAWTQGKVFADYNPGSADPLQNGQLYFRPTLLSIQHQQERWGFTAEFLRRDSRLTDFGFPDVHIVGDNFFIQADYRLDDLSFFLRYDQQRRNNDDPNGKKYEAETGRPGYSLYAKDWTVGGRWDISQNLAFNAELHVVEGAAWLSVIENQGMPKHKYWNLFLMSFSARF